MVVNQAVIDVRIVVLFLTNFPLQEVLEVSLWTVWAVFSMVVIISKFLISMLGFSDDGLSFDGSFQIRLVEWAYSISEDGRRRKIFMRY